MTDPAQRRFVPRNRRAAGCLAGVLVLAAACATPSPPRPQASPPATPPSLDERAPQQAGAAAPPADSAGHRPAVEAVPAWSIPAVELATRRLYRVQYQGPEGQGSFRLTLELTATDRYRARAVDLLGRPLWSLSLQQAEGLWVDHRAEIYCRLVDRLDLAGLPLAPFPLVVLPPLLLGRLPEPPAPGTAAKLDGAALELVDDSGRRWTASLAPGDEAGGTERAEAPTRWSLWGAEEGSPPLLTWLRTSQGEAVLSDRVAGVQLRWREVVAQPLSGPPEEPSLPPGYRQLECRQAYDAAAI